jgi:hypothetical protein
MLEKSLPSIAISNFMVVTLQNKNQVKKPS